MKGFGAPVGEGMAMRGSYWLGTGRHQAAFKRLRADLVTVGGTADTPHGDLLRAVAHLYNDLKRHRFRHVADRWGDWCTVRDHCDRIAAAIGPNGTWVIAVVDRAITDRYLWATNGPDAQRPTARFPTEAFETLVDGCVLAVGALHAAA